jgi:hypothetical protein
MIAYKKNSNPRGFTRLSLCIFMVPVLCSAHTSPGAAFPAAGQDVFASTAVFKVVPLTGPPVTISGLSDPATVVGRSNPFTEGAEVPAPIAGGGLPPYAGTSPIAPDPSMMPVGWLETPPTRRELHTEILSLNLMNGSGAAVRAGQPFFSSVSSTPQASYYGNSFGEVTSLYTGAPTDLNQDFPADSFFNICAEVQVGGLKYYNRSPMLVRVKQPLNQLPPNLGLPNESYIHDPTFPAVPLVDANGLPFGYLLSAGHGAAPPGADAQLQLVCPVSFSVDALSEGLNPSVTMRSNAVFVDKGVLPLRVPVTVYVSSGDARPSPPDLSNERSGSFTGIVPGAFQAGDAITSMSFGRDGTNPAGWPSCPQRACEHANFYFSVSRTSSIPSSVCSGSDFAADIFVACTIPFGAYTDVAQVPAPLTGNRLAVDSTFLGLRPILGSSGDDNLTALELKDEIEVGPPNWFFGTFSGPSFSGAGARATIRAYQTPPGPSFSPANLTVYAPPATMGLGPNDAIDALVLSDVDGSSCILSPNGLLDPGYDEALFSLTPDSPSLWGADGAPGVAGMDDNGTGGTDDPSETGWPGSDDLSPADIFYTTFTGTGITNIYATAAKLGLLTTDDVDAADVKPRDIPHQTLCPRRAGACCNVANNQCTQLLEAECKALGKGYVYRGDGTPCGLDGTCIPTVSQWGLGVMTLLVLTAATVVIMRRRAVT